MTDIASGGPMFGGVRSDETTRERLILSLTATMTREQAETVVESLESYLEEGPGNSLLTLPNLTPDFSNENKKLRAERDAALELAEQTIRTMSEALETLRKK